MNTEKLRAVEVTLGRRIWSGTRPIPSTHVHLGYVMYNSTDKMIIAPELTYSFEGRRLRVGHELRIDKTTVPKPHIAFLSTTSEETSIVEIYYEDPFHRKGILTNKEARAFRPSTLCLLGYRITENKKFVWLGLAVFKYADGTNDYETVHVIPKSSIQKMTYFRPVQ